MKTAAIIAGLAGLVPLAAMADGRSFNTSGTLDWLMVEQRIPYFWAKVWSPYESQFNLLGTEGAPFGFYTGVGSNNGGPTFHWSAWPVKNPINPGDFIKIAYNGTETGAGISNGGEGSAAGFANTPPSFVTSNVWYRFVLRAWLPADGTPHQGYFGQWIRDGATAELSRLRSAGIRGD